MLLTLCRQHTDLHVPTRLAYGTHGRKCMSSHGWLQHKVAQTVVEAKILHAFWACTPRLSICESHLQHLLAL